MKCLLLSTALVLALGGCRQASVESVTTTNAGAVTSTPVEVAPSARKAGGCETLTDVEAPDTLRVARPDGSVVLYANEQVGLAVVDVRDPDRPKVIGLVESVGAPAGVFEVRGVGVLVFTPADRVGVTTVRAIDIGDTVRTASELTLTGIVRDARRIGDFVVVTREIPDGRTAVASIGVGPKGVGVRDEVILGGGGAIAGASPRGLVVARDAMRELGPDRTSVTLLSVDPDLGALGTQGTATFSGVLPRWRSSHRVLDVTEDDRARFVTCPTAACDVAGPAAYAAVDFSTPSDPRVTSWNLVAGAGEGVIGFQGTRLVVARASADRSDASEIAFYHTEKELVPAGKVHVRGTVGSIVVRDSGDVLTVGWTGSVSAGKRAIVHHIDGRGAPRLLGAATFGGDWTWTRAYDDDRVVSFDPASTLAALPMTTVRGALAPTSAAQVLSLDGRGPQAVAEETLTMADRLLFVNGRLLAFSPDGVVVLHREGEPGTEQRWEQLRIRAH